MSTTEIPLFPLRTVLVPGGYLPLRIFEPRYLDMVRDCSRDNSGFGVCLILEGTETGSAPRHARTGTLARIRDFHTLDSGLLGITAQGHERFGIERTRSRDDGLMVAEVRWLEEPRGVAMPDSFLLLSQIVERFMDKLESHYPEYRPACLEDASWVGYRLVELLPIGNAERLQMLELHDPLARLQRLLEIIPRFQEDQ